MIRMAQCLVVASALLWGSAAMAQLAGVSEAQLDKGFLGEQNVRNTDPGSATDAHYLIRANKAVSSGDFNKALAILRLNRATATHVDAFLAGQAHVGLGDYAAARKDYRLAMRKQRNSSGAHLALGEMEARFGEKTGAEQVLAELTARREACKNCSDRAALDAGISRIEAILASRQ
jgi:hypothetical protein